LAFRQKAFSEFSDACHMLDLPLDKALNLVIIKGAEAIKKENVSSSLDKEYLQQRVDEISELVYFLDETVNELRVTISASKKEA
jgi:hypothetical protein